MTRTSTRDGKEEGGKERGEAEADGFGFCCWQFVALKMGYLDMNTQIVILVSFTVSRLLKIQGVGREGEEEKSRS